MDYRLLGHRRRLYDLCDPLDKFASIASSISTGCASFSHSATVATIQSEEQLSSDSE